MYIKTAKGWHYWVPPVKPSTYQEPYRIPVDALGVARVHEAIVATGSLSILDNI